MEVHAVPAYYLRLTAVEKLSVGDLALEAVDSLSRQQQMRSVHFGNRSLSVTSHLDVSGQETHLSPHLKHISAMSLNNSYMLVLERSIDSNGAAINGSDSFSLSLSPFETGRCDYDFLTHLPVNCVNYCQLCFSGVYGG